MANELENKMVVDAYWNEPKPKKFCDDCSADLYEGDIYYDFDGFCVCPGCLDGYLKTHFKREVK